jgi:putative two-component system response regulator
MPNTAVASSRGNILVVDDTPENLTLLTQMLGDRGYRVQPVASGLFALKVAASDPPDLILLDIRMPEMDGFEVCRRMKEDTHLRDIPVIFISALTETDEKVKAFHSGGVDYVTKPFQIEEIEARVATHLRLRNALSEVARYNNYLEQLVDQKVKEISDSQLAAIFAMVKLAESRDDDTGTHIWRVREYCLVLAKALQAQPEFSNTLTEQFVADLYNAAPLHDVGKVGIPDSILLKPDKHTPPEFEIMKTHTSIGARTLQEVIERYPKNSFIILGAQIAASHHERWDGSGYPSGLKGDEIPLAAQIMTIADVYDALRTSRRYKPAFNHSLSLKILIEGDQKTKPSHFNPRILRVFERNADAFEAIHHRFGA